MQTTTRFHLCLFALNDDSLENAVEYNNKTASLYECVHFCQDALLAASIPNNKTALAQIPYDMETGTYLCLAGYKNRIFCGIYNSDNKTIRFEDKSGYLVNWNDSQLGRLESAFRMSCNYLSQGKDCGISEIKTAWSKAIPLLDKVIDYQEKIEKLPEDERNREDMSLRMEETIDACVREYENGFCLGAANTVENSGGLKENAPDICEIIKQSQEAAKTLPVSEPSESKNRKFDMSRVKKGTANFSIGESKNAKSEKGTSPAKSAVRGWSK